MVTTTRTAVSVPNTNNAVNSSSYHLLANNNGGEMDAGPVDNVLFAADSYKVSAFV